MFSFLKSEKKYAPELLIEEIISTAPKSGFLGLRVENQTFQFLYVAVALVALIFIGRIAYLAWGNGTLYAARARQNANGALPLTAERGVILDKFKKPLAQNQPVFSASLKIVDYLKNQEVTDEFLFETLGLTPSDLVELISKANLEESDSIMIARDLEPEKVISLKSRDVPGLEVQNDFRRLYPQKNSLAHVLGYVNYEGLGKTGVEFYYDDLLRGVDGLSMHQHDAKGNPIADEVVKKSESGKTLTLTIDGEFQDYFYNRFSLGLAELGRTRGVGLAVDPRNGEILAAISLPAYDNNLFTKRGNASDQAMRSALLSSGDKPMFNRVVSGIYNPASTIKPLLAVAALAEHVVDTTYGIFSPGYIEIPNPYAPEKPIRFLDWRPQGWVNVYSALARSSNVYFYEVGGGFENLRGLGIDRLIIWWKKFGLGERTGVDIPGEADGFLPNPDEKEKRTGQIWRIGDTYNVSIGQGDLLVTPLQLLNYISSIANGGYLYEPHFNKDMAPKTLTDLSSLAGEIKEVQLGMMEGVQKPYGTSYLLHDLPFRVAAKTGSAQTDNNAKTNAFFVGYAPASDYRDTKNQATAQIAVLILIENAKEGSLNAVPIAKDVLNWYYEHRLRQN